MQYVIFGASGFIGSYLYRRMEEDRKNVIGTHYKKKISNDYIEYDILKDHMPNEVCQIQDKDRTAIICIAQSNIGYCYENQSQAYNINVLKTKELIHELAERGFQVIFFSTDNVFDGSQGNYTEKSKTNGINQYGKMKAEVEDYILENEPGACIFRISKVVSSEIGKQNILSELEQQAQGGCVWCIRGNRLSFVAMEDIYQACLIAGQKRLAGLYQVAGDKDYSRLEFAELFYHQAGIRSVNVAECCAHELHLKDERPLDISMSNMKFKTETGYSFTPMDIVIEEYLKNKQS